MIHAVIMAGGSGTRFWPASRKAWPKQFMTIGSTDSMLSQTAQRMLPLCSWERIYAVASQIHVRPIRQILPELPGENLILEPRPRNTAPAIGLAAFEVSRRDPDATLVVLPADHVIQPPGQFRKLIRAACTAAKAGALLTLGVRPTRPETGYGYICAGRKQRAVGGFDLFEVAGFAEKPDQRTADEYLRAGNYYWNSGMFVFTAKAIMHAFERHMPALHRGLERVRQANRRERKAVLKRMFDRLEGISIDYGVMEKADNIQMLPYDLFWSDVGSWAALPEVLKRDAANNVRQGDVLLIDSRGCVIHASKRLVACVGLEDTVVVETPEAVLVCPLSKAQAVKQIVETLRRNKRGDVL